ncbi:MAG: pyridoxine 5'-phosphate synthase [Polyangiaceae bacterium]
MSVRLHVNVDHVATVRNARGTEYPDPVRAATVCLEAGAHGITAHLREDRRHIRDEDVARIRSTVKSTFNLEMAATDEMVAIAVATRPDVVTLVPERREERTTEGGLDVVGGGSTLRSHVKRLVDAGIKVSLFIGTGDAVVRASKDVGATQVELHTGEYAHASGAQVAVELGRLRTAAALAHGLGLEVAAGHGLTLANVPALVTIPEIVELNIGHALVADAIFLSLAGAVRAMNAAIGEGRARVPA